MCCYYILAHFIYRSYLRIYDVILTIIDIFLKYGFLVWHFIAQLSSCNTLVRKRRKVIVGNTTVEKQNGVVIAELG